jgi:citrate synthase
MTFDADPGALQCAVAAGILGCGTVILGSTDQCRNALQDVLAKADLGTAVSTAAHDVAEGYRAAGKPMPGFGHPLHKPVDPRAERLIALARETGVAGPAISAALALTSATAAVWRKALPMNVSMAIAAVALDADIPSELIRGIPILARTAGLLAHLGEESESPIGFYMASKAEDAIRHTQEKTDVIKP